MDKPEQAPGYHAGTAIEFFRAAGKPETVAQGETIFSENEKSGGFLKRAKMYLLLDGEVNLVTNGKTIGSVHTGEIFGEMASISQSPRSATAVAVRTCRMIALDDKQFQNGLQSKPEFALMMMSVIIARLRRTIERLGDGDGLSSAPGKDYAVFDKKLLAQLAHELGDQAIINYEAGRSIMKEGQSGALMFAVMKGTVAISISGKLVEKVGPGGVFGEMALVEKSTRLASAAAETDCSLLGVHRNAFLALIKNRPDFTMQLLSAVGERAKFVTSQIK